MGRIEVTRGVYQVGGSEISHGQDASVFLVQGLNQALLIDAGAGWGSEIICEGHFGIFNSRQEVRHYIENYLRQHGRWGT